MKTKKWLYGLTAAAVLCMLCAAPQDPWKDPANAKLQSLNGIPTTLTAFHEYACTLHVAIPELVDSIKVVLEQGSSVTTLLFLTDPQQADSLLVIKFTLKNQDQASLHAYLYRPNRSVDSLATPQLAISSPHISSISLPAAITAFQQYSCSLHVVLPDLLDSIVIKLRATSGDSTLSLFKSSGSADSVIVFTLLIIDHGWNAVQACLYRQGVCIDSLSRQLTIRFPPTVTPDSAQYHTYVKQPVAVKFNINDPDGDIRSCTVWVDSTTGTAVSPRLSGTSRSATSVTDSVSGPSFDTLLVFAQAIDSAGNGSGMAQCTVFVADTVKPTLSFLRIAPSVNDSFVNKLPCSLFVKIKDDSPIDSAAYAVNPFILRPMTMMNDTVALAIIATLDSGANIYTAQAWDKAGNLGTLRVPIYYTGTVLYRFTFSNLVDRTVNENGTFPPINLDSTISLTPPPVGVPNWKANVQWQILEQKPDSGIKATFNPVTRIVTFAVPDSEWSGAESFTFIASLPDMATGYAGVIYRVNPINDPPIIIWKSVVKKAGVPFDTIWADKCASDPDDKSNTLAWTQDTTVGKIYTLQWLSNRIIINPPIGGIGKQGAVAAGNGIGAPLFWGRKWQIVTKNPKAMFLVGSTYHDTLRVTVTDPGGLSATKDIPIIATY